jgi:curved DNA-binding protein CbpA
MTVPDPYKILQVDSEAEHEVIEAAYRRLARKYHPDVAPGTETQERMVRINQAWEMLKDPMRRAAVDRARARQAASAATVAASEAKSRTAAGYRQGRPPGSPPPASPAGSGRAGDPAWPPSARDPSGSDADARTQRVSPDWTPGRSSTGSVYDASMRPAESAGPPPGNPSGTVLAFGRYAGWSLGEIARTDLEYLEWLDRMPIGRAHQAEIDTLLRARGRRKTDEARNAKPRGFFRRP